jgi:hypothetical protein
VSDLHIHWTAPSQPATKFSEQIGDVGIEHVIRPHVRIWCSRCRQRRLAKHLRVIAQAYYDPVYFCADEAKCRAAKRKARRRRR